MATFGASGKPIEDQQRRRAPTTKMGRQQDDENVGGRMQHMTSSGLPDANVLSSKSRAAIDLSS